MTDTTAPMLEVEGLTKLYAVPRGTVAGGVADATFTVPKGAFFTLLGPSGCGKTTTLRCLAGLEQPDKGRISIAGQAAFDSVTDVMVPVHRRDIGMVFQSYAIWPHMNVYENISFPLRIGRAGAHTRSEIDDRVSGALQMVGLSGYERRPATDLSGGQQQRLALARAVIHEPKLLLLDEPLSNLDAKLREELRVELKRLQQNLGITTVYVTHDQAEALAMSDLIAVLDQGRLVQIGSPHAIYYEPGSEFVARFVGAANLFRGQVIARAGPDNGVSVRLTDGTVLVCRARQSFSEHDEVSVAVRPEAIQVERELGGAPRDAIVNRMRGRVRSRTFLGQSVNFAVQVGEAVVQVMASAETTFAADDAVTLALPAPHCIAVRRDTPT